MKRSTRMMLMSSGSNRRYNDGRSYENYDVDDKFRDRRGREHYDNGRYAPRSEMMEPEDRDIVDILMAVLPLAMMVGRGWRATTGMTA